MFKFKSSDTHFFRHLYSCTWRNHIEKPLKNQKGNWQNMGLTGFCLFVTSTFSLGIRHFGGSVACWLPCWRYGEREIEGVIRLFRGHDETA